MKRGSIFFILIVLCSMMLSCRKSFLDVTNKSELTRQGYVTNLATMGEYVNGIYGLFSQYTLYAFCGVYPELTADNLKPLASSPQFLMSHYMWVQQKTDGSGNLVGPGDLNMNAFWQSSYLIIRECNFVVENVEKYRDENPQKADQIKGEVLALRALLHFDLVNMFAQTYSFTPDASHPGVPYIVTSDITTPFSRQTVAEVYKNMIEDLQNAIAVLSPSVFDARRLNVLAAKGILARVYLFKGDFTNAKSIAREVIGKCPLTTMEEGYPDVMFVNQSSGKSEILFQATPGDEVNSSFIGRFLNGETTFFLATNDIVDLLREAPNDIRSKWVTNLSLGWTVTKFPVGVAGLRDIAEADYYQPIVRSSEMFLTAAEGCAQTGEEEDAILFVNEVRRRADPTSHLLSTRGPALIDSIYKERRKELAFEGLRMFDLQRWKRGVYRQDALNSDFLKLPYPNSKAIAPIPINDVTIAGLLQNNDY